MSKPYDTISKRIIDDRAPGWVGWLLEAIHLPPISIFEVLDSDLSTFSLQADKLFRLGDANGPLFHLEVQSSRDDGLPFRLLRYNVSAGDRYGTPVFSVVILLRPEADFPGLTGVLEFKLPNGQVYHRFEYFVIRLWEQPAESLLHGDEGLWPLALLTDDAGPRLPELIRTLGELVQQKNWQDTKVGEFWMGCELLLGLRYDKPFIDQLFEQVQQMEESSVYQGILERGWLKGLQEGRQEGRQEGMQEGQQKGEVLGLRRAILRGGANRFGAIPLSLRTDLEAIHDIERLERMIDRILSASDWTELLATL